MAIAAAPGLPEDQMPRRPRSKPARGRLYDPAAVDACIALFRNKGFAFQ
jgi:hypothetical protein